MIIRVGITALVLILGFFGAYTILHKDYDSVVTVSLPKAQIIYDVTNGPSIELRYEAKQATLHDLQHTPCNGVVVWVEGNDLKFFAIATPRGHIYSEKRSVADFTQAIDTVIVDNTARKITIRLKEDEDVVALQAGAVGLISIFLAGVSLSSLFRK